MTFTRLPNSEGDSVKDTNKSDQSEGGFFDDGTGTVTGRYNDPILTFVYNSSTKDLVLSTSGGKSFTVDLSPLADTTISAVSYDSGLLTLTKSDSSELTVNIPVVADWAVSGNSDIIPDNKLNSDITRNDEVESFAKVGNPSSIPEAKIPSDITRDSEVSSWAKSSNVDTIPDSKIPSNIARDSDTFSGDYDDLTNKPTTITGTQSNAIVANTAKNSYPTGDSSKLAGLPTGPALTTSLSTKVDKVSDKGLSTNDLTDTLKTKYDAAEANVNPDWSATTGDAFIKNKPTIPTSFAPSGAEANVQSNWTEANTSNDAYIKNKPTLFDGHYSSLSGLPTTITTDQSSAIVANTAKVTYPAADASKLAGIADGAQVNVPEINSVVSGQSTYVDSIKESIGVLNFVGSHSYLSGDIIANDSDLYVRKSDGTSRTTFDATEKTAWEEATLTLAEVAAGMNIAESGGELFFTDASGNRSSYNALQDADVTIDGTTSITIGTKTFSPDTASEIVVTSTSVTDGTETLNKYTDEEARTATGVSATPTSVSYIGADGVLKTVVSNFIPNTGRYQRFNERNFFNGGERYDFRIVESDFPGSNIPEFSSINFYSEGSKVKSKAYDGNVGTTIYVAKAGYAASTSLPRDNTDGWEKVASQIVDTQLVYEPAGLPGIVSWTYNPANCSMEIKGTLSSTTASGVGVFSAMARQDIIQVMPKEHRLGNPAGRSGAYLVDRQWTLRLDDDGLTWNSANYTASFDVLAVRGYSHNESLDFIKEGPLVNFVSPDTVNTKRNILRATQGPILGSDELIGSLDDIDFYLAKPFTPEVFGTGVDENGNIEAVNQPFLWGSRDTYSPNTDGFDTLVLHDGGIWRYVHNLQSVGFEPTVDNSDFWTDVSDKPYLPILFGSKWYLADLSRDYYNKTEVDSLLKESGTSWIDYIGGIPGDSTFLENGDEIIPYNEGAYFRLITSADVDSFYTTRTGNVLTNLLVTRGG